MLKKVLAGVALSAVSISAMASGHFYVGGQAGYVSHYGFSNPLIKEGTKVFTPIEYSTHSRTQGTFGGRVFVGYMFNRYLGLEVGAGSYGSQRFAFNAQGSAKAIPDQFKLTALMGIDESLVAHIPLTDKLFGFAKAGIAAVEFRAKSLDPEGTIAGSRALYNWNWMPRAELGLGYNITPDLAVTVSYSHYFGLHHSTKMPAIGDGIDKGEFKNLAPSFGMAAVGLTYTF